MEWSDIGIVLNIGPLRESDLWVRLLTPKHGIVSVFAFGGSKSKRRFCGCLGLLNELKIRVQTSRNGRFLSLQEALFVKGPIRIRKDINKLGVFVNCMRFLETLGVGIDSALLSYNLVNDLFHCLEEYNGKTDIVPILFRLRVISDQGYAPKFFSCAKCGTDTINEGFFKVSDGIFTCKSCTKDVKSLLYVSTETLRLFQCVQNDPPNKWMLSDDINISMQQRRECTEIINAFVQYHVGIFWNNGRFYRR